MNMKSLHVFSVHRCLFLSFRPFDWWREEAQREKRQWSICFTHCIHICDQTDLANCLESLFEIGLFSLLITSNPFTLLLKNLGNFHIRNIIFTPLNAVLKSVVHLTTHVTLFSFRAHWYTFYTSPLTTFVTVLMHFWPESNNSSEIAVDLSLSPHSFSHWL